MFSTLKRSRVGLVVLTLLAMAVSEASAATADADSTKKMSTNSDSIQKKKKAATKPAGAHSPATQAPQSATSPSRVQSGYRPDNDLSGGY